MIIIFNSDFRLPPLHEEIRAEVEQSKPSAIPDLNMLDRAVEKLREQGIEIVYSAKFNTGSTLSEIEAGQTEMLIMCTDHAPNGRIETKVINCSQEDYQPISDIYKKNRQFLKSYHVRRHE